MNAWRMLMAAALSTAAATVVSAAAPRPAIERNLAYGPAAEQRLDLYRPATPAEAPLVVFVHGGGWIGGNKDMGAKVAPALLAAGYAVASVSYRLVPQVRVGDQAQDVAAACAYLLAHAQALGLDTRRFGLLGTSAGGHLVALVATDPRYAAQFDVSRLAAVITLDGLFDLTVKVGPEMAQHRQMLFGGDPAGWRALSPQSYVDTAVARPRFCLIHEDKNPNYASQAAGFAAALTRVGRRVEQPVVHGLRHPELAKRFSESGMPMARYTLACLAE